MGLEESPGHPVPGQGLLYALNTDHSVDEKLDGIELSNGIAWSPDERIFYYIDSLAVSTL